MRLLFTALLVLGASVVHAGAALSFNITNLDNNDGKLRVAVFNSTES